MSLNGYFTLNSVFFSFKFKIYLLTYRDSAMISMEKVRSMRAGPGQVNLFQQTQAYYLSVPYN